MRSGSPPSRRGDGWLRSRAVGEVGLRDEVGGRGPGDERGREGSAAAGASRERPRLSAAEQPGEQHDRRGQQPA